MSSACRATPRSAAETDETFGDPKEGYLPNDTLAGSGGTTEFTWRATKRMVGPHTVVLQYGRSWEADPIDTFRFTVNVVGLDPDTP